MPINNFHRRAKLDNPCQPFLRIPTHQALYTSGKHLCIRLKIDYRYYSALQRLLIVLISFNIYEEINRKISKLLSLPLKKNQMLNPDQHFQWWTPGLFPLLTILFKTSLKFYKVVKNFSFLFLASVLKNLSQYTF